MPEKKEEDVSFAGPYVLTKVLGQGSYGKVRLGVHGKTGAEVAVKIMHKTDLTKSTKLLRRVEREVTILRLMNHPCVTQMIDVIQTATHLFIILEYMQGGDLYQYLRKNGIGGLPKDIAFRFFYQILSGLEYCHSCGVCHRDIKPENILLDAGQQNIKITDFGMANLMKVDQLLETSCGSPHYASPEVIQGVKYDGTRSDVWSMGVLLFGLCAGRLPFDDANIPRLLEKVCRGLYTMPNHFDGQLRDLIDRCLQVSADNRIRLKDIKQHPWWIEKCRQGNLPVGGLHTATLPRIAGAPRPSISNTSNSAPPPVSTPKANSTPKASVVHVAENSEDGSTTVANSETLGLNHPLLAINVSKIPPSDLPNVFQKLQDFAKALVEENTLLRECFSAMHNESMPQLMEPPMSPEEMSRPVEEPFDETVVEFITVYQGWTDMTTLVSSLADERPNIEKAFYKLLLQQKTIYGGLNHLKEQGKGVAAHVSPINPIKKLEEIQGILSAQYAAPLRSQRVKSDSALVVPSDLTNLEAPKRKGIKGVFSKVFGKEKDKRSDISPSETPPATPGSSSNSNVSAPPINPINKAPTNVQFLSPRDRQRSAPALVSKKIHVG